MSDPLNPWEEKDRLAPTGDLSPMPEGDARDPDDENPASELRSAAAEQGAVDGDDANDLEADNAVEADTIETLDPENPPA
ncbi:hypothetical protein [Agromyces aerolatus]|uniref:hypothetical protein n=1 Tax=Agromyces sp. LY-1074 TaxID=3074080 RepID=UPI00285F2998|nr:MULTISPECIES: hypothetical protein [unclassified Agromyces]MDR5699691.1 hypothetical protein [Agromyces sp. LY-1074]MDR5705987.1 hypothetical protein [Agromyces sp. LY-1358]